MDVLEQNPSLPIRQPLHSIGRCFIGCNDQYKGVKLTADAGISRDFLYIFAASLDKTLHDVDIFELLKMLRYQTSQC